MVGDGHSPDVTIGVLGPLEARVGGRPAPVRGAKQETLLALLAAHAGAAVPTDRIIDELWGDTPPASAQQSLQMHVSRLRRALRDGGVDLGPRLRGHGYALDLTPEQVDARRFERAVAAARRAEPAGRRAGLLEEALGLWRGDAFAGVPRGSVLTAEAARLEALRLGARLDLAEDALRDGRPGEASPDLHALVREHPYDERARLLLMTALARSGRTADALAVFRDARARLVEDLGMEPGAELRAAHERLLRAGADPAPRAPAARPVADDPAPTGRPPAAPHHARGRRLAAAAAVTAVLSLAGLAVGITTGREGLEIIGPHAVGIVDPRTGGIQADIAAGGRIAGLAAAGGSVWVANAGDGMLLRVDREDLRVEDTVRIGHGLSAVAAGAGSVWAVAADSRSLIEINARINDIVRRIRVGNGASAVAVGAGAVWVVNALDGTVSQVDPRAGRVVGEIPVGRQPSAVAVGAGAVWVANEAESTVTRIDPRRAEVVATIPVGGGPTALAPGRRGIWVANAVDGTISRIDPAHDREVEIVEVPGGARAVVATGSDVWVGGGRTAVLTRLLDDGSQERTAVG